MLDKIKQSLVNLSSKSQPILVFLYSGVDLYAVVAHPEKGQIKLSAFASSRTIDAAQAISELVEKMALMVDDMPKQAVLCTVEAVSGLIDLPIDPDKPRPYSQMQELMRWEVDPFISEFNDTTTVGALLQGRGYIDAEQRDQISLELDLHNNQGERVRYGEMVLELNFIQRDALDECLGLQEYLVNHEESLVSGWQAAKVKDEKGETQNYWSVAAIGQHRRNHWSDCFEKSDLELKSIYPVAGSSIKTVALKTQLGAKQALIVEIYQEQFNAFRIKEGRVVSIRQERRLEQKLSAGLIVSLCFDQLRPEIEFVDIVCNEAQLPLLQEEIENQLQRKIRLYSAIDIDESIALAHPSALLLQMQGIAASHLLSKDKLHHIPAILASDPLPALWKRQNTWRYGVPAIVIVGLIALDSGQRYHLSYLNDRLQNLEKEYKKTGRLSKQYQQIASKVNAVKERLEKDEKAYQRLTQEYKQLDKRLYSRIRKLPAILRAIASSVNGVIVLNSINEYGKKVGIRITGSTLSNRDAIRFVKRLSKAVEDYELEVRDTQVEQYSKRIGREGFSFNLWLVPKNTPKAIKKAPQKNQALVSKRS